MLIFLGWCLLKILFPLDWILTWWLNQLCYFFIWEYLLIVLVSWVARVHVDTWPLLSHTLNCHTDNNLNYRSVNTIRYHLFTITTGEAWTIFWKSPHSSLIVPLWWTRYLYFNVTSHYSSQNLPTKRKFERSDLNWRLILIRTMGRITQAQDS